jgi:hypothetical protein
MKQEQMIQIALFGVCAVALYLLLNSDCMQTENFIVDGVLNTLKTEVADKQSEIVIQPELKINSRVELEASDLLPEDSRDTEFAVEHPLAQGSLANKNFLEAGKAIGQLSEPLRNSNLSIRAEPVIERQQISPWMNSTKPMSHGRGMEIQ